MEKKNKIVACADFVIYFYTNFLFNSDMFFKQAFFGSYIFISHFMILGFIIEELFNIPCILRFIDTFCATLFSFIIVTPIMYWRMKKNYDYYKENKLFNISFKYRLPLFFIFFNLPSAILIIVTR